jgi:hypothetical protein
MSTPLARWNRRVSFVEQSVLVPCDIVYNRKAIGSIVQLNTRGLKFIKSNFRGLEFINPSSREWLQYQTGLVVELAQERKKEMESNSFMAHYSSICH